ncbi:uncharacterized protein LOC119982873 isoform X2 [Tripterygium wilfordii]|uniref:uncharacterized protein LOC119982873 isoform X2 n=1 Tax=Tripterygium wilfordii TaxID=458696 RepID=UPI0018F8015D|nr:uncharacterized protein LOC119982873 isoform X2 [Tripterygium wilfordii]
MHFSFLIQEGGDESRNDKMAQLDELVREPQIGMVFSTIDEMLNFYRKFGKQKGFSVKRRSLNKDKNVMTWIEGANRNMSLQVSPHFVTKNVPFTNDPIIKREKGRPPCTRKKPIMRRRGKRIANQDVNNLMDVNTQSSQRQTTDILTEVRGTQGSHVGYSNQGRDGGFLSLLRNASEVGETLGSGGYQSLVDGIDEDM